MEITIELLYITGFVGFVLGFVSCLFLTKQQINLEKKIAISLLLILIGVGIIAFFLNRELPSWIQACIIGLMTIVLSIDMATVIGLNKKVDKLKELFTK